MKTLVRLFLIVIGSISVFLGVIGIVLPVLPTTPFLLLAAVCYLKSSNKLYYKLINHKYLGFYIKSYYEKKGITKKTKIVALSTLWASILFSAFIVLEKELLQVMLLIIASLVTYHILKQKTLIMGGNHNNINT